MSLFHDGWGMCNQRKPGGRTVCFVNFDVVRSRRSRVLELVLLCGWWVPEYGVVYRGYGQVLRDTSENWRCRSVSVG
jgi:hypothetical protein